MATKDSSFRCRFIIIGFDFSIPGRKKGKCTNLNIATRTRLEEKMRQMSFSGGRILLDFRKLN